MESNSNNQLNFGQLSNTLSTVGKAFAFKQTFKIKAILIGLGLLIVGVVGWLIYRSGLKKGKGDSIDYNQLPIPNNTTPQALSEYKKWLESTGTQLADKFYIELGFTWTNTKLNQLIYDAGQLSDEKLLGLSNIYNLKNADESRRFVPDLENKTYLYSGDDQRNLFVQRLKTLGSR